MTMSNNVTNPNGQNLNFGDTTLTKVFVGGLAWETQREALRAHFENYGEILEAVIILDKASGRSKGYGFVTFEEPEAAKKACEDGSPIINGRRANCNLASLGAKRPRATTPAPPPISPTPQQVSMIKYTEGVNVVGARGNAVPPPAPSNHVRWFYPPPPSQFHHHHHNQHHQPLPYYGYPPSPVYIAPDMSYNHKMGYTGGSYMNGQFSQVYPAGRGMMPMYPIYQYYNESQTIGLPAHIFPTTAGPIPFIPKPTSIVPNTGYICQWWPGEALKRPIQYQKEGEAAK